VLQHSVLDLVHQIRSVHVHLSTPRSGGALCHYAQVDALREGARIESFLTEDGDVASGGCCVLGVERSNYSHDYAHSSLSVTSRPMQSGIVLYNTYIISLQPLSRIPQYHARLIKNV
jgi:hypothetical protein